MGSLNNIVRAVRPDQWVKNLLVLSAPIAAGTLTETSTFLKASFTMILFIFASSAVYVFNDMRDKQLDTFHPIKSLRPVALGQVSCKAAVSVGFSCFLVALTSALFFNLSVGCVLIIYFSVNIAYSLLIKNVPFIELFFVASGFTLRAIAGGLATDTPFTFSYISVVSFSSLYLISCKRYSEFVAHEKYDFRPVLKGYSQRSLLIVIAASIFGSFLMYLIWVSQDGTTNNVLAILSLGIYSFALLRFGYLAKLGSCENPARVLFEDQLLVFMLISWVCLYVGSVYG
ncbi:MAG: UbiA prenyltransferase family protein [Actinomycetota bacterium]